MEKFQVTTTGNTLKIVLEGKFENEDINAFGQAYSSAVSKINPSQFTLDLSIKDMSVVTADKQDGLKNFFLIYKKDGFKKVVMNVENNVILAMQAKRLAKEVGITDFEIK